VVCPDGRMTDSEVMGRDSREGCTAALGCLSWLVSRVWRFDEACELEDGLARSVRSRGRTRVRRRYAKHVEVATDVQSWVSGVSARW
jgi:hypothetical protein